jgi:type IV secretory pathway VirD2 relaxase
LSERSDDRFRPKLGPPRAKSSKQPRFIALVLKAASQAGAVEARNVRSGPARSGPRYGRGRVAARMAGQHFGVRSRRVTVKVRHVKLQRVSPRSAVSHLRYLEREGVSRQGEPGRAYGPSVDEVDAKSFEAEGHGDRHQFRMIVSLEDGAEVQDLKVFTRSLMQTMEADLGTRLEWIAVDHWDTDHPHTHIVLRGKDHSGKDLVIDREYLTRGLRMRASELATQWLGPRTQHEIDADWSQQVGSERWTSLDGMLDRHSVKGTVDLTSLADLDLATQSRCHGRLQSLARMGLAEKLSPFRWQLAADLQSTLKTMSERGDIIRTLQRVHSRSADYRIFNSVRQGNPIVGRIAGRGLHDEISDRGYVIIEALDANTHYVALPSNAPLDEYPVGGIVRVRHNAIRAVDQNILAASISGVYRSETHLQELRASPKTGLDPQEFVQSHVRRLEALRRAGIVERAEEGAWRVPIDLPNRGQQYDRSRTGGVEIQLISAAPVERQRQAIGATWLDQQLIAKVDPPATDFGLALRAALKDREQFLIDHGLAQRRGTQVTLSGNLLGRLRDREIQGAAAVLERSTGLTYRATVEGERVSGTYRQAVQLTSGKFAMLDDGVGFSLVPWRSVLENRIGQSLSATIHASRVSWEVGRSRGLSI